MQYILTAEVLPFKCENEDECPSALHCVDLSFMVDGHSLSSGSLPHLT